MARLPTRSIMEAKPIKIIINGTPILLSASEAIPELKPNTASILDYCRKTDTKMSKAGIESLVVPNDGYVSEFDDGREEIMFSNLDRIKKKLSVNWTQNGYVAIDLDREVKKEIISIYRDSGWFVYNKGIYTLFFKKKPSLRKRIELKFKHFLGL
jgi:hypothetical protein